MSEPAPFSPDSYDLSEAALKELYLERDDEDVDVAELIADADGPKKGDQDERSAGGGQPARGSDAPHPIAPTIAPLRAPPRELTGGPTRKTRPGGKITAAILGVGVLLILGWANYHPTQTPRADAAKRPPAIAGLLHVADFAAGRKINPGENYGVDLPAGKVRVAVVAGEVRLTTRSGDSLRACSNQPFVIDEASGSANSAPLVTACGREPALLQAEIPQPPLPAPAPIVAISPSTLRTGGD